jgi:hypothetical protein
MGRDLWSAANRIAPAAVRVRCLRESGAGPRDLARARGGRLHTSSGRRRGGHVATSAMDSARTGGRHGDVDAVAKRGLGNPCLVSIFVTFFFCRNRLCLTFLHLWKDFDPRSVHWAGPSSLQVQGVIGLPLSHQGYFGPARGKIGSDKRVFLLY